MTGTGESRTGRRAFQLLLAVMFLGLVYARGRDSNGQPIFGGIESALQFIRVVAAVAFVFAFVFFCYDVLLLRTGRSARPSILSADIWLTGFLAACWMLCVFVALGSQPFKDDSAGKLATILAFGNSLLWILQTYLLLDYLPEGYYKRVAPQVKKNYSKLSITSNDTVDFYADDDDLLSEDAREISMTDDPVAVLMVAHNESIDSPTKSTISSLGDDVTQDRHGAETFFMEDEDLSLFQ